MGAVKQIIERLKGDPRADTQDLRAIVDDAVFDLFEISASREAIRRFYRTVGLVEPQAATATGPSGE